YRTTSRTRGVSRPLSCSSCSLRGRRWAFVRRRSPWPESSMSDDKITIDNFTSPGHISRVNREKFTAMRDALLAVLPDEAPGMTVAEAKAAVLPHLPETLFPGGAKAGWWLKAAQLD